MKSKRHHTSSGARDVPLKQDAVGSFDAAWLRPCGRPGRPALRSLAFVLGLLLALPASVHAHGEVHIRINALTRQIEAAPQLAARLYLERGEFHRQDQNWVAAEADYNQAAGIDPQVANVDFYRARMLADAGRFEAARTMFDRALRFAPADGEVFIGRARVQSRLDQVAAARADYQRGLELLTQPAPGYFVELAQLSTREKQLPEALRILDWGVEKLGPSLVLQIPALEVELELKRYDAALVRVESILQLAHRKENWLAQQGDILLAAGRQREARQAYEAALATIKTLPRLVQQGPAMTALQKRVTAALSSMAQISLVTQ